MNNWQPSPSDIAWTRRMIDHMKDGSIWGIPRANSLWKLDKNNKVMVQIYGYTHEPDNAALRVICPLIGWTTAYRPESLTPAQVEKAMEPVVLTPETFGTGKSISRI